MTNTAEEPASAHGFAHHALLLGAATIAARASGYVRTLALASVIGVGSLANAFGTANAFPNMAFEILLGGALRGSLVPAVVGEFEKGEQDGWRAVSAIGNIALLVLGVFTVIGVLGARWIFRLLTFGLASPEAPALRVAGTVLLALMVPQILFYGIDLVATGALNAHRRFVLPTLAVVAGNLVAISAVLWFGAIRGSQDSLSLSRLEYLLLGGGMTLAVATIAGVELVALRRLRARYHLTLGLALQGVRRALRAGGWMVVYVLTNQLGLLVVLVLANRVRGGVAAYQYAYTFLMLPYGVVGLALGSALLPEASTRAARGDRQGVAAIMADAIGLALALLVPVSLLLAFWGEPIAQLLLGYGAAKGQGAAFVGRILSVFALGLVPFTLFQLLARASYAFHRTRTPALVNAVGVAVNILVDIVLFGILKGRDRVVGLAAGQAAAYLVAAAILWFRTNRLLGQRLKPRLRVRAVLAPR